MYAVTNTNAQGWDDCLESARAGSPVALGELLESCRNYLLLVANRQLRANLKSKVSGSDIVQETFLEAQRDFTGFAGQTRDQLYGWLRRILLHNLMTLTRSYQDTAKRLVDREVSYDRFETKIAGLLEAPCATPADAAQAREEGELLKAAIDRLPPDYRTVIDLRHGEQLPFQEIARRMDRSTDAIIKLWLRGLGHLRQNLGISA